jgi:hypothetical protein
MSNDYVVHTESIRLQEGFERMVDKVADLEKQLGVYDLAQFTPEE